MKLIRKKIEFIVSGTEELSTKTIEYFKKSGFKQIDNAAADKTIKFERGSIAANMWTFNPLNWKSEIDINIEGESVRANFNISITGQVPTVSDEQLWETFIANYKNYLLDVNFDFLTENAAALKNAKGKNLKFIGWTALGGLMAGVPATLVAYWTEINIIVPVGAAIGAIALLTIKINKDKNTR